MIKNKFCPCPSFTKQIGVRKFANQKPQNAIKNWWPISEIWCQFFQILKH